MDLQQLTEQIQPVPDSILENLPESERIIFKNYKIFPIEILVKADWNYKTEDEERSKKLQESLKRHGQIETMHVRKLETGYYEVVNGNHRLDDMIEIGKKFVIAYDHGEITQVEAKRIAIQTNELRFDSDPYKLGEILAELSDTFGDEDINSSIYIDPRILDRAEIEFNRNQPVEDIIEDEFESDGESVHILSERGDLYELNNHRLLVGDSTNDDDVARLMNDEKAHLVYTDPPYNVNYVEFSENRHGNDNRNWGEEIGSEWTDSMSDEDYSNFLIKFISLAKKHSIEYAHYYVWFASKYFHELTLAFKFNELSFDGVPIIWLKQVAPLTYAHYRKKYEPCLFGGKDSVTGNTHDGKRRWFAEVMDDNVWEIDRDHNANYVHPTQKPVALAARALRNSSKENEIVLDLFLGSGTTMICAEQMNRICYGMEYEPRFADEIVKRYLRYCESQNIESNVKRNGEQITLQDFEMEVADG